MRKINAEGTTIILTTHYLEEAESLCRNIAIINHGQIIENTTIKHLLDQMDFETIILDLTKTTSWTPTLEGYHIRLLDPTTLEVEIPRSSGLNSLFRQLDQQDIEIKSLRNKTNRLEELFIALVYERKKTAINEAAA